MKAILFRLYDRFILGRPLVTLCVTMAVVGFFVTQIPKFKLDASGDSLVLERDADLRYHRQMVERYGTQEVLVITFTPRGELFSDPSLAAIRALRDELARLDGVESVTTILDVPLLYGSGISLGEVGDEGKIKTLEKGGVAMATARAEMHDNPLYRGRLLGPDGKTTAILVNLEVDETCRLLLKRRYELREKKYDHLLTPAEARELAQVSTAYRERLTRLTGEENRLVREVRRVMDRHRGGAQLFLGGVPMIVADMVGFIKNDLAIFGVGVACFLIVTLAVIFRRLRWVLLPLFCSAAAVLIMLGLLGLLDWRVTVISSNFISLMIILTMSLTIHIIQRFHEVYGQSPGADRRTLVRETVQTIALPCFYTTLTTAVAFISLLVSGIRPVIDFGKMMTIGLGVAFILAFILFPATVLLLGRKGAVADSAGGEGDPFTLLFARLTQRYGTAILVVSLLLAIASGFGIARLKVENRFIDYFRKDTEIYQGMSLIDRKLGGTTPLELVIDFKAKEAVPAPKVESGNGNGEGVDDLFEEYEDEGEGEESPWFADLYTMEELERIHDYLAGLPEIGETLSLATTIKVATRLNKGVPLENYELALLNKRCPDDLKKLLISPYVSEDIPQARFAMRVVESEKSMERMALLNKIRGFLVEELALAPEQIHFTGMFVLYNNMLQSLFRSQILTIGLVFMAILAMFVILFRSPYLAVIATIPNMLPVAVVLGALGWLGIPLDMMTITIASITIGIAVDDTIHYIHRFQREFLKDRNYLATVYRCHRSIGRAMYYTTVTITIGFSILVLSNFIPTIYFGLFTGFAMVVAVLADLMLLPQLLLVLKPLGPEGET